MIQYIYNSIMSYTTYTFDNEIKQKKYSQNVYDDTDELLCIKYETLSNNKCPRFGYENNDDDIIDKTEITKLLLNYDNFDFFIQNSSRLLIFYYDRVNYPHRDFEDILKGTIYEEEISDYNDPDEYIYKYVPLGFIVLSNTLSGTRGDIQFIEYIDTFIQKRNLANCLLDYIMYNYHTSTGINVMPRQLLKHCRGFWEQEHIMKYCFDFDFIFNNYPEIEYFMEKYEFELTDKINKHIKEKTKYLKYID
jgi:hypothetical protein